MQPEHRFSQPVPQLIRGRTSCRSYDPRPIEGETLQALELFVNSLPPGPFGNRIRIGLAAARPGDAQALKRLGTYGFISQASCFIIGAVERTAAHNLEDFGYLMQAVILRATDLGLGTCWLGGAFTKSSFSRRIAARESELVPAVVATGYPAPDRRWIERLLRPQTNVDRRLPWEKLFFQDDFSHSLAKNAAGKYAGALEMVRLAPSATNEQPWRMLRAGRGWHFYLRRTPGYRERLLVRLFTVADLQRIDLGIAMCHFELSLTSSGLAGRWLIAEEEAPQPLPGCEYIASWE